MTLRFSIAFLDCIIISGCASCPIQTFDKLTQANRVDEVRTNADGPKHIILKLGEATIDVNSCWETGLCANISLPENQRLQFATDEFLEVDVGSGEVTKIHKAPRIYYVITCEEDKTTPRTCISSELSPVSGSVDVTAVSNSSYNDWKQQYYKKAFSSTLEFVGATEMKGSLSKPISSYRGQRQYQLPIFTEHESGVKSYVIRFPKMIMSGKSFKLPDIRVEKVNESICNYRAW